MKYPAPFSPVLPAFRAGEFVMLRSQSVWSHRPMTVAYEGPNRSEKFVFDQPFAVIGSSRRCEITIPDASIPGRKYYLHAVPNGVFCLDLTADPGESCWLSRDKPLRLGEHEIRVLDSEIEAASTNSVPLLIRNGTVEPPEPELHFSGSGRDLGSRKLKRRLALVGRAAFCAFNLSTRSLSTTHCVLYWDDRDLWFVDLHSRTGCQTDGVKKTVGKLRSGSQLSLGRTVLTFNHPLGDTLDSSLDSVDLPAVAQVAPPPVGTPHETRELESQLQSLQTLVGEQEAKIEEIETQRERMLAFHNEQIAALEEELSQRADQRDQLVSEHQQSLAGLQQDLSDQQKQAADARAQVDSLTGELAAKTAQLEELQSQLAAVSKRPDQSAQLSELQETADQLTKQVELLESENQELKDASDQARVQRAQLESLQRQLQETNDRMQAEQKQAATAGEAAADQIEKLELALQTAKQQIAEHRQVVEDLTDECTQLRRANAESQSATEALEQLNIDLDRANEQNAEYRELVAELEAKCSQLTQAQQQTMQQNQEENAALDQLKSDRNQVMAKLEQLQSDHEQLVSEREQQTTEREQLTTERDQLTTERDQHKAEREQLKSELERERQSKSGQIESLKQVYQQVVAKHEQQIESILIETGKMKAAVEQSHEELRLANEREESLQQKHQELLAAQEQLQQDAANKPSEPWPTTDILEEMIAAIRKTSESSLQAIQKSQADFSQTVESLKSEIQSYRNDNRTMDTTAPVPVPVGDDKEQEEESIAESSAEPSGQRLEVFNEKESRPWDKLYNEAEMSHLRRLFRWLNPFSRT